MKKALVLCSVFYLSSCVYAGEVDVLSGRRSFFDAFQSNGIDFRDNTPKLVKTEYINEKSFKKDEILTAFKGYSVLSDKTFVRSYYVNEKVRAVGNVVLSNVSVPYHFYNNQTLNILGYTWIDGVKYSLVATNELPNYAVLFNSETGKLYHQTGQIKDGRLVLLRQEFVASNPNFRFEPVFTTTTEQSKPIKGFDIKYDGLRLNRMWFVYFDYASSTTGGFKEYDFPKKPGLLKIGDVKIRVLAVDDQRIDYMVLSD